VPAGFGADPEYEADPGTTLFGLLWAVDFRFICRLFSVAFGEPALPGSFPEPL
jgi:hypothetical protein